MNDHSTAREGRTLCGQSRSLRETFTRAAAGVCVAFAASALLGVARADDPQVSVFTDGPQTVTLIRGCHLEACVKRLANTEENGRLRMVKGKLFKVLKQAFTLAPIHSYWVRLRVVNGSFVCEKFAVIRPRACDDEDAAYVAWLRNEPCS